MATEGKGNVRIAQWTLLLGLVGIVALFFLFTREITRFVQFMAVAIAVVVYTPSVVQAVGCC